MQHPERVQKKASNESDARVTVNNRVLNYALGEIDDYTIGQRIGRGKYSNVFSGHKIDGTKVVIKVLKPVRVERINREVHILKKLQGAPYITQLMDIVRDEDSGAFILIFDWCSNTDIRYMYQFLTKRMIAVYMYKLMTAVKECHRRGIMHRDIKPGNIMFDPNTEDLKLIDWGLAELYQPGTEYHVRVATKHYKGPELLLENRVYGPPLDIWCAGCTFASLLFQKTPFFKGSDQNEQLRKIAEILGGEELINYVDNNGFHMNPTVKEEIRLKRGHGFDQYINHNNERNITREALQLLKQMLTIDPDGRPTAEEVLRHPFFDAVRDTI